MKVGDIIEFPPLPDINKCGIRKPIPDFQQTSDEERVKFLIGKTIAIEGYVDNITIVKLKDKNGNN